MRYLVAGASAVTAAAVCIAVVQLRGARRAGAGLEEAKQNRAALQTEVASWETKVKEAGRRAIAAERDTAELLGAVKSLRAQPTPLAAPAGPKPGVPASGATPARAEAVDGTAVRAQHTAAAASDGATTVMQSRAAAGMAVDDAAQARLAQERAYQQQLAKKRAEEAIERAKFDEATSEIEPAARFAAQLQRAREQAARAEFAAAIRTFNEAMAAKPPDLPVPPDAQELQAMLQAQSTLVEVVLISDGETFVSITYARAPAQFTTATAKLLPGDYEAVGRRRGYRDVVVNFQLRNGQPPAVVTVRCTQLAGP